MKLNANKLKNFGLQAAIWLGLLICCAVFWFIVIEFMWACNDAGIPM